LASFAVLLVTAQLGSHSLHDRGILHVAQHLFG
jgi:hypothetical protein